MRGNETRRMSKSAGRPVPRGMGRLASTPQYGVGKPAAGPSSARRAGRGHGASTSYLFAAAILLVSLVLVFAAGAAAQTARPAHDLMRVGPSVHVSGALPSDPQYEVEIDANPQNASELIACTMVFPNDSPTTDVVTYVSADGGKTWKFALRTKGGDGHPSWDPDCRFGPGNVAYSLSEGFNPKYQHGFDRLDRSMDGGQTWETHYLAVHGERSFLTVNQRPGPRQGWLYLYGSGDDPKDMANIRVGYSPDGGKTLFSQLVPLDKGTYVSGLGPGALLSDGTLVIPVEEFTPPADITALDVRTLRPGFFKVVRVKFQEANWPLEAKVSTVAPWFIDREPNGSFLPRLAVDSTTGPFHDRIYATWESRASGRSQVLFSYSKDQGKTWSHPQVIDDDVARVVGGKIDGPDDIHGIVAVNNQGVVGVMWLDRRDFPDNLGWSLRFRASLDGGETFLPSVKASSVDYDPSRGGRVPLFGDGDWSLKEPQTTNSLAIGWFTFDGGHTMGLAADAQGKFHPLWVANPTGIPQLWTTDIAVEGKAEKNGEASLAGLKDASKLVRLEFLDRYYDLKTHSLTFDLQLENVSKATIHGPLKVRVLGVGSYVGSVTVMAGGVERPAEGAVWDFSSLLPGEAFKPGERTKPLRLRLFVRGIDPFSLLGNFSSGVTPLAVLTTKVLAGSIEEPKKEGEAQGAEEALRSHSRKAQ